MHLDHPKNGAGSMSPPASPLLTICGKDLEIVTKIVTTAKRNDPPKNANLPL
jgi:hypothetical protein